MQGQSSIPVPSNDPSDPYHKPLPRPQDKKYDNIAPAMRMAFIKKVLSKQSTIKEAAEEFGIKFSTSKAILQTFRREGRVGKKKFRQKKIN
jgi:transposase